MGKFGPVFTPNAQKWANWGFRAFFFFNPKYTEMVKFGFGGLFFSKTHRNGSVWVFGPIFPQEHSEMGEFGF